MQQMVNNSCNIFVKWEKTNSTTEYTSDELQQGYGYKPVKYANEIFSTLFSTRLYNDINLLEQMDDVYWKIPFFGGGYFNIKTLLKIQQHIAKEDNSIINLISEPTEDDFRLGNIRGEYGIGQVHGQKAKYNIYTTDFVLESEPKLMPPFFSAKMLASQIEFQTFVSIESDTLNFEKTDEGKESNLMNEFIVDETDMCSDTVTRFDNALMYYNNDILRNIIEEIYMYIIPIASEEIVHESTELFDNFKELGGSNSINNMRNIVKKNQDIRDKLHLIYNTIKSDESDSDMDISLDDMADMREEANRNVDESDIRNVMAGIEDDNSIGTIDNLIIDDENERPNNDIIDLIDSTYTDLADSNISDINSTYPEIEEIPPVSRTLFDDDTDYSNIFSPSPLGTPSDSPIGPHSPIGPPPDSPLGTLPVSPIGSPPGLERLPDEDSYSGGKRSRKTKRRKVVLKRRQNTVNKKRRSKKRRTLKKKSYPKRKRNTRKN